MAVIALGRVTAGIVNPVSILQNRPDLMGRHVLVNTLYFQVDPQNTGDMMIGDVMYRDAPGNPNNILATLRPPTSTHLPDLAVSIPGCPNPFDLDEIYILAGVLGNSLHVFALQW